MSAAEIAYCGVVLLLAYSLRGSSGFGAVIGMPLLALVIPVKVLAPAWTLLGIASSLAILGKDRAHVAKRPFIAFLPWCALGIAIGLFFFKTLDAVALARALGVLILLYAAYSIWLTQKVPSIVRPAASVLSGAVGTMFGAMATIFFAMYLQANALEKHAFRATISAMLLALSVVRAIAYVSVGEFSAESMVVFLAALPAMALGIWVGGRIHAKISETAFKRLVCAILVVCAIPLLLK